MEREVFSSALDDIAPSSTQIEQVATNFGFTEGPVWIPEEGALLFSDIPKNTIYRLEPGSKATVYRHPSGHSNGLTRDSEGRLIACEHGNRRVSRTAADGQVTAIATHYGDKRLNSPNDVVVASDGAVYFTDPPYGLDGPNPQGDGEKELAWNGVYRLDGSELRLLADDFDRPNGLAFSLDERTLYIGDTPKMHIRAFDVTEDGSLTNSRVLATLDASYGQGRPDGMKLDSDGRLYVTGAGGVWVIEADGTNLGLLRFPEVPANIAWGGPDANELYVTARTSIYRVRLQVTGVIPGPSL